MVQMDDSQRAKKVPNVVTVHFCQAIMRQVDFLQMEKEIKFLWLIRRPLGRKRVNSTRWALDHSHIRSHDHSERVLVIYEGLSVGTSVCWSVGPSVTRLFFNAQKSLLRLEEEGIASGKGERVMKGETGMGWRGGWGGAWDRDQTCCLWNVAFHTILNHSGLVPFKPFSLSCASLLFVRLIVCRIGQFGWLITNLHHLHQINQQSS